MTRGLVFAGGGVAGVAWELGVLMGIRDLAPGTHVADADIVVGTSAGATVGAQVTSGIDLAELYDRQLRPESTEIEVDLDFRELFQRFAEAMSGAATPQESRLRIGRLALNADTVPESARRVAVAGRLPCSTWPDRALLIPAVDVETGDSIVFTKDSGVDLVDAVVASSAVPGVWPPATVNGRRYTDGGVRSLTNADLATGCDRVLVILPARMDDPSQSGDVDAELASLKPATGYVIYADEASQAAFGTNPLSPATRGPAALAGREVGRAHAARVAEFWA
jgi:NTE family protein